MKLDTGARISIAMASYNGAAYISRQLDSIANQRVLPDELVVCDDHSTDNTVAIVEEFAAGAKFQVRVVRNAERLGYNRNFAKAIGLCHGEIIFVSDQDDEWYSDKLAVVSTLLVVHPRVLAVTNDQAIVRADGSASGATVLQNVRRLGYSDLLYGPGCCTAFRRSMLNILDPFPGNEVPYDHWLNIIPALLGARLVHDQPLQSYRRHGANTSGAAFALERPTGWTLAARGDLEATRKAYAEKIRSIDTILVRLTNRGRAVEQLGLGDQLPSARRALERERDGYAARLECLSRGRIARMPLILRNLRAGGYRQFQGYRSAVKDLVA
jgi:glycosyltransferase involved in cell wall biosynthesis